MNVKRIETLFDLDSDPRRSRRSASSAQTYRNAGQAYVIVKSFEGVYC